MLSRRLLEACACALIAVLLISTPSLGDENEPEAAHDEQPGMEHEHSPNHFGGFIGVSTHSNADDMGPTIGLEYARMLSKRFAVAGYVEMVSSRLERDVVVAAGVIYYPLPRLGLMLATGLEAVEKEVTHHDETKTESETELLIRTGVGYGFPIAASAGLGPVVFVDWASERWTLVFGLGMTAGF